MAEISNSTLAVMVFATLALVIGGTVFSLNQLHTYGLTGFVTTDTGNISLTINSTLAIQVDPNNATINFGTCTPRAGSSYWCATNDTQMCQGDAGNNCSGDTVTSQFIRVDNVGNVDANLSIRTACDASQLIGGTAPAFTYVTSGCNSTDVTSWTAFTTSNVVACTNVSKTGPGKLKIYANVTIPHDAVPTCGTNVSVITFTASATQ